VPGRCLNIRPGQGSGIVVVGLTFSSTGGGPFDVAGGRRCDGLRGCQAGARLTLSAEAALACA
jgi:hypothetical protein